MFNNFIVLIIDDDVWMQRILSKIVAGFGFIPVLATNGYEGVALALENPPVLVLLDVLMPELSGHQTLRLLKQISKTQNIPVVMVTAVSDLENIGLAVKSGAAGFVGKPFTRATIFEKLREVLGKDIMSAANLRVSGEHGAPKNTGGFLSDSFSSISPPLPKEKEADPALPPAFANPSAARTSSIPNPSALGQIYQEEKPPLSSIDAMKALLLGGNKPGGNSSS
jgi:CheY-like chemotaxis protein